MMETSTAIPARLFSAIIPNLISVLKHTQSAEGVVTPQAKQALLQATNDLKNTLTQAKDYASSIPGGELNFQEQDELLLMLEKLRGHKWQELAHFAHKVTSEAKLFTQAEDVKMEVDSTASTPFGS
ncbi:hypothetical protein JVT61DRAFT_6783 [Boletus reticuloceps]|uniref:Mediator of RNA polymerase II transcription subunit 9 n=1 Tax=Boletus reticuloceps TaxID=495285 RepID=A0A8I2YJM0_9AGAM|nr:hypothetical protein JVT61DRAFT_6783 [Boletus reticuloceps]